MNRQGQSIMTTRNDGQRPPAVSYSRQLVKVRRSLTFAKDLRQKLFSRLLHVDVRQGSPVQVTIRIETLLRPIIRIPELKIAVLELFFLYSRHMAVIFKVPDKCRIQCDQWI